MKSNREVTELGWMLMNFVREIDQACTRPIKGVESGLCNVKSQFAADVEEGKRKAPPRSVKEEDAITWMMGEFLNRDGKRRAAPWVVYPTTRKTCDLVVDLQSGGRLWLEVKLAWKAWFNCSGTIGRSSSYIPYLLGSKHKTHSTADDFGKLQKLGPPEDHLAMLLIGFDTVDGPMDSEVGQFHKTGAADGWVCDRTTWHDRRCPACRINCWFWQHAPAEQCGGSPG